MRWWATSLLLPVLLQMGATGSNTGIVTGSVRTRAGTPLTGIRVAVQAVENDAVLESIGLTDERGRYRLEGVRPGRYHVVMGRVDTPLYHPGELDLQRATVITVAAGSLTEVAEMVYKTLSSVSGRVIDSVTGQPRRVASLKLCCDRSASPGNLAGTLPIVSQSSTFIAAQIHEDGTFTVPSIAPGNYSLQVSDPGIVPTVQTLSVGSSEDITGLEVRVTAGIVIRGRIVDRLKQPVGGIQVSLKPNASNTVLELTGNIPETIRFSLGGTSTPSALLAGYSMIDVLRGIAAATPFRTTTVAADGTFLFSAVIPGKYALEMSAAGQNSYSHEITVGVRENVDVPVELPFTRISGGILTADGSPLPPVSGSVRLIPSDPNARMLFGFPEDDGRFSILMAPGEYRLFTDLLSVDRDIVSVSDGSADLKTQTFAFDGTRPVEIRITIAR